MRACVFTRPHEVAILDWEDPTPRPGHVVVRVASCGVCGTDRHIVEGSYPAAYPNVLGHEISGTVEAAAADVAGITPGDRVAIDPNISDGICPACRRGDVHLCEHLQAVGVTRPGGLAPRVAVPASQVHPIPQNLSLEDAAFAEPLSCIVHGIERVKLPLGGHVAVLGAGSIGLMMLQALRALGAGAIVVSEPSPAKRQLAESLGADEVYAPQMLEHASHDSGYDLVVDCTGVPRMLADDIRLARRGADILLFGVAPHGAPTTLEPYALYQKELRLVASNINPYTMDKAIALLGDGLVKVSDIVSHPVELDELPQLLKSPPAPSEVKAALRFS
jgi:L-iditol 2-dehydrogenase